MNVRWTAVLTGFIVDVVISSLLALVARPDFYLAPDFGRPDDVLLLSLATVLTSVSGYVAGRMAGTSRALNGFLVQIVSILVSQLGPPLPRPLVISYVAACLFAALGGYLSRYPPLRRPNSSG